MLPREHGRDIGAAFQDEHPLLGFVGICGQQVRREVPVVHPIFGVHLDLFEFGKALGRADQLDPAGVRAGWEDVDLVPAVIAVLGLPEVARDRVDRQPEAVADPVGPDHLDVFAGLATERGARPRRTGCPQACCRRR